jgi:hypothetical protein
MYTTKAQICIRRDTAANFTSANPTLALGEIAYETDTRNLKVGDGSTTWQFLPYINPYRAGTASAPTSNTVLGSGAGASLQSGALNNVIIGDLAGDGITTGDFNVAIGSQALTSASAGNIRGCVAIGYTAAQSTTGSWNIAIGEGALLANTSSEENLAIGLSAARNTTGGANIAIGSQALMDNTTGASNVVIGKDAGRFGVAASAVIAVGASALTRNRASDNVAVGFTALQSNTLGTQNLAIGRSALAAATTQAATVTITTAGTGGTPGTYSAVQLTYVSGSTAITYPTADIVVGAGGTVTSVTIVSGGDSFTATSGTVMTAATASIGNTTGFTCTLATVNSAINNTAVGHLAGTALTTADRCTFVGALAGDAVTTGIDNTAMGAEALSACTTGFSNAAFGAYALANDILGTSNVGFGWGAGLNIGTASALGSTEMVCIGANAGRFFGSGSTASDNLTRARQSIFLGGQTRPAADDQLNQIVIGNNAIGNGSNTTTIGNSSTTGTFIPAGNLTLTNGNFIVGTSGKGIDFSATPGTGTSELLADYEEGTWTPTYEAATGTFTTLTMDVTGAKYIKVGKQVTVIAGIRTDNVDATGASGALRITGFPFANSSVGRSAASLGGCVSWAGDTPMNGIILESTSRIDLYYRDASDTGDLNVAVSDMTTGATANQNNVYLTATYFTD